MDENKEKAPEGLSEAMNNEAEITDAPIEQPAEPQLSKAEQIMRALDERRRKEEEEEAANAANSESSADNSEDSFVDTSKSDDSSDENDDYDDDEYEEDEKVKDEPKKKKRKKRKKRGGIGRLIFGLVLATVIVVVSVSAATLIIDIGREFLGVDKLDTPIEVEIPLGATTRDIADILVENGVIEDKWIFVAASKLYRADALYIAGTHIVRPNMAYETIIKELQKDALEERETVDVTFPEGISIADAAKRLEEAGVCEADKFIETFNTVSFGYDFENLVKTNPLKMYKMEGYLFPDTYRFYKEEEPRIVAKKIYLNFATKVTPDYFQRMQDLGLTLEETIILASIVQGEASVVDKNEMKKVASVFLNRLNDKANWPRLESDATIRYVNKVIKPNIELESEEIYNAYNTYVSQGLPPGAIGNPGLDAITAVLYPAETDYMFFCSNLETGEFFYAETLSEHEDNLVKAGLK